MAKALMLSVDCLQSEELTVPPAACLETTMVVLEVVAEGVPAVGEEGAAVVGMS